MSVDVSTGRYACILGDVLRDLRSRRGWTRKVLAARLRQATGADVSTQTLATYELGTRHMTVTRLHELCAVFGMRPSDVLATVDTLAGAVADRMVVDLRQLAASTRPELMPARRWAHTQLHPTGPDTTELTPDAVASLSCLCGLDITEMVTALRDPQTPRQPPGT